MPHQLITAIFGRRNGKPNIADSSSTQSVAVARHLFEQLGITRTSTEAGQTLGTLLEQAVREILSAELPRLAPSRPWVIGSEPITHFQQYAHLATLQALLNESETLRAEIGTDYLIKPDVTVAIEQPTGPPFLHAAVPCKWTIRSDRVQNIRHEGVVLTRHRRGRQPHVVTVTAEPMPARLSAIARGTGEVDCVYHAALDELHQAVAAVGNVRERGTLDELIEQDRLRPLDVLPEVLAFT